MSREQRIRGFAQISLALRTKFDHRQVIATALSLIVDDVHRLANKEPSQTAWLTVFRWTRWIGVGQLGRVERRAIIINRDGKLSRLDSAHNLDLPVFSFVMVAMLNHISTPLVHRHLALIDCSFVQPSGF